MTRRSQPATQRLLACASVGALACVMLGVAPQQGPPETRPSGGEQLRAREGNQEGPDRRPHGEAGDRGRRFRGEGEFGGPQRGPMFDDETVLKVIRDIAPEMAAKVEEKLKTEPDATRELLRRNGRRIMGLVALSKNNPKLYSLKVEELQLQAKARRAAVDYHEQLGLGHKDEAEQAKGRIRQAAAEAINAGIRARGEELKALTEAVANFKKELEKDARRVPQDTEDFVNRLLEEKPVGELFNSLGGGPASNGPPPGTGPIPGLESRRPSGPPQPEPTPGEQPAVK